MRTRAPLAKPAFTVSSHKATTASSSGLQLARVSGAAGCFLASWHRRDAPLRAGTRGDAPLRAGTRGDAPIARCRGRGYARLRAAAGADLAASSGRKRCSRTSDYRGESRVRVAEKVFVHK